MAAFIKIWANVNKLLNRQRQTIIAWLMTAQMKEYFHKYRLLERRYFPQNDLMFIWLVEISRKARDKTHAVCYLDMILSIHPTSTKTEKAHSRRCEWLGSGCRATETNERALLSTYLLCTWLFRECSVDTFWLLEFEEGSKRDLRRFLKRVVLIAHPLPLLGCCILYLNCIKRLRWRVAGTPYLSRDNAK